MDNKKIQVFSNKEFGQVRTLMIREEPYFVGKDVAEILGYSDTSDALKKHVDDEDKMGRQIADSLGRMQNTKVINESGLYSLILSSKLPNAKKFKRWVTSEVLPTIRKTGGMVVEGREEEFVNNYFPSFSEEVKLGMVQDLLKKNKELKPKADYYDKVLMPTDGDNNFTKLLTVTEVAKDLGISAKKLNNLLHEKGIIFKKGKTWHLYSQHQDKIPEYADYHITEYSQTLKFTEKGRKWILEMLNNEIK